MWRECKPCNPSLQSVKGVDARVRKLPYKKLDLLWIFALPNIILKMVAVTGIFDSKIMGEGFSRKGALRFKLVYVVAEINRGHTVEGS